MSEIPQLKDFNITPPVFVRKIQSRGRWNPESSSIEEKTQKIVNGIFTEEICSLWRIRSNEDFYGFVASISSTRRPQNQDIDFIHITDEELTESRIKIQQTDEGNCLKVQSLHYNASIDKNKAIALCKILLDRDTKAQRCKKRQTELILEYQKQKGCFAVTNSSKSCICETKNK